MACHIIAYGSFLPSVGFGVLVLFWFFLGMADSV